MGTLSELVSQLRHTKRGSMLIVDDTALISTTIPRIETEQEFRHPLYDLLVQNAFVPEGSTIPVLSDGDVLDVFAQQGAISELPQFPIAGARATYRKNPADLTVGVLTAGGNAPGLDAVVDSLVKRQFLLGTEYARRNSQELLTAQGYSSKLKFFGILGGYKGLLEATGKEPAKWVMELHPRITDAWSLRGCSSLYVLRTDSCMPKTAAFDLFIDKLVAGVRALDLDVLYAIGGNGTLKIAAELGSRLAHIAAKPCLVVAGPKTMDNDINFTDVTFGFRTTADNAIRFLFDFHRETETLQRVGVVELFGAGSGFVALHSAYASGEVDYVLIPETMGTNVAEARAELRRAIEVLRRKYRERRHALLVVAEGATLKAHAAVLADGGMRKNQVDDLFASLQSLLPGVASDPKAQAAFENIRSQAAQLPQVADQPLREFEHQIKNQQEKAFGDLVQYIGQEVGEQVFASQPRHLIRATPPGGFDLDLCKYTGKLMVDTALAGFTCCAVHLWQGNYLLVPLTTAIADLKRVDTSSYYFVTMSEKYLLGSSSLCKPGELSR